jgi:hypothetical protein
MKHLSLHKGDVFWPVRTWIMGPYCTCEKHTKQSMSLVTTVSICYYKKLESDLWYFPTSMHTYTAPGKSHNWCHWLPFFSIGYRPACSWIISQHNTIQWNLYSALIRIQFRRFVELQYNKSTHTDTQNLHVHTLKTCLRPSWTGTIYTWNFSLLRFLWQRFG